MVIVVNLILSIVNKLLPRFPRHIYLYSCLLLLFFGCLYTPAKGQFFDVDQGKKRVTIPFRLVRNMIIIKLKINNKGPYNFILDTGVGLMIITEPKLVDSIEIPHKRVLKLYGLGEGDDYEAYATEPLKVEIPGLTSYDVAAALLKKDHLGLSSYAGMPIHGLLGYEFFNNLAVKLDFGDSTLTVCRPKDMRTFRKGNKIPIKVEEHKPYMTTSVRFAGQDKKVKLIIDLGAGHPLSLDGMIQKQGLPTKFIAANLGVGFNGPIYGFISRVDKIDLGSFKMKNVITSFPENDTAHNKLPLVRRDGNLGLGILKRFDVIIDYPDSAMYLKAGPKYREPFEHDMSGLEYYAGGDDFKHVIINRVEPGSAADAVGLEKDDEITAINFKPVASMSLEEIDNILKSSEGRNLLLEIYHDHKYDHVILTLKRRI